MARRGLTGQLNMFDFFRELETNMPQDGEQEMVSLMPNFDDDPEPVMEEQALLSFENEIVPEPVVEVKKETKLEVSPVLVKERKMTVERTSSKISTRVAASSIVEEEIVQKEEIQPVHNVKDELQEISQEKLVRKQEKKLKKDRPVMQRAYNTKQGIVEIAYMNYSKVRVSKPGQEVEIKDFDSSKEAVDYYVEQMQKLEELYAKEN